jgi:hypothetical protein
LEYFTKDKIKIILEENSRLFEEADYLFKRYGVDYCIALFHIKDKQKNIDIDFTKIVRVSDRYINISHENHLFLFSHTKEEDAYSAIYAIDRKLIKEYGVSIENYFIYGIKQKEELLTPFDMLKQLVSAVKLNSKTKLIVF